jgi:hypothetical protein
MQQPRVIIGLALAGWAMAVTLARAIRWPNDFAEAHWLIDYRFGFIRRGLMGEGLSWLAATGIAAPSEPVIAALAACACGGLAAALLVVAARLQGRPGWSADSLLVAYVFVTSPFVVMSAHLMGYFDHILAVTTMAAAWLACRGRFWSSGAVAAASVLVHENVVATGLPVVALAAVAGLARQAGGRARWRAAVPIVLPLVPLAMLASVEFFFIDRGRLREQLTAHLLTFGFVKGDFAYFVPEWLTTSMAENLRQVRRLAERLSDPWLLQRVWPSLGVLLVWGWRAATMSGNRAGAILLAGAALAPLALHAVAWDTARIWTYPLLAGFVGAWILAEMAPAAPPTSRLVRYAAFGVLLTNVYGHYPLMDGQVDRLSALARTLWYAPVLVTAAWFALRGTTRPLAFPGTP